MYRVLTVATLNRNYDLNNLNLMFKLAEQLDLRILPPTVTDGRQNTILLDGEAVTLQMRSPEVDLNVSIAARPVEIRSIMRARQREITLKGNTVVIGRDAGTHILPEALLKIYLEANSLIRASRRLN